MKCLFSALKLVLSLCDANLTSAFSLSIIFIYHFTYTFKVSFQIYDILEHFLLVDVLVCNLCDNWTVSVGCNGTCLLIFPGPMLFSCLDNFFLGFDR